MKKLLLLPLCLCLVAATSFAGTVKLPSEKPVASVTIPDSWKTTEIEGGVEATSDDEEVYIALEATDAKELATLVEDTVKFLKEKKVTVNTETQKKTETKLNGMDFYDISWDGKDEDGPAKISLSIITLSEKKALLVTYWASPEGEEKHKKQLTAIAQSIKSLAK